MNYLFALLILLYPLAVVAGEEGENSSNTEQFQMITSGSKSLKMYEMGQARNKKIVFYGKVVDQSGEAVSNAKVHYTAGRWKLLDYDAYHYFVNTDSHGNFIINNIGQALTIISIEKEGYDVKTELSSFNAHPRSVGDTSTRLWKDTAPNNPFVFHAWRKANAEPLVYSEKRVYMPFDGTVTPVDLTNKGSADLKISIVRSGSRHAPSDWQAIFEVVEGGLLESNEAFMNQAPEKGYKHKIVISYKKNAQNFVSRTDRSFFLKTNSGQIYARLEIQIRPFFNDQESANFIKYWLNPNGSRNLQYDPSKRIPLK